MLRTSTEESLLSKLLQLAREREHYDGNDPIWLYVEFERHMDAIVAKLAPLLNIVLYGVEVYPPSEDSRVVWVPIERATELLHGYLKTNLTGDIRENDTVRKVRESERSELVSRFTEDGFQRPARSVVERLPALFRETAEELARTGIEMLLDQLVSAPPSGVTIAEVTAFIGRFRPALQAKLVELISEILERGS